MVASSKQVPGSGQGSIAIVSDFPAAGLSGHKRLRSSRPRTIADEAWCRLRRVKRCQELVSPDVDIFATTR